jgi:ankyrin repeat protein
MNPLFYRICHFPILRQAAFTLFALAWSNLAFCGEIHDAAKSGDLEKIKALLIANPDLVSSKGDQGETPLHLAAFKGHKDVAELLLRNKADVNAKADDGRTPLQWAAVGQNPGYKDVAELLLANKAEYNINDAAELGELEKVKALLANGPNLVTSKDSFGRTPLHSAAENGNKAVVELLLANNADVNAADKYDSTPLHFAAMHDRKDAAKLLLANKAHVNAKDQAGATPLHYAAAYGHEDVAELLLANNAEYNVHDVAYLGDLERIKGLLKDNPDLVFSKDSHGQTPLHCAAMKGHRDVVKLLLDSKADVNAKDGDGLTPLHSAAGKGFSVLDFMFVMLGKADVNPKDGNGDTAAEAGYEGVATLLLDHKADVNARCHSGMTPLHYAAFRGQKAVVKLLLDNKADVNAKDDYNGLTPLHIAAKTGHKDVAELLRQHGAHE